MGNDYAYLAICKDDQGYKLELYKGSVTDRYNAVESLESTARLTGNECFLRVEVKQQGKCIFSYSENGQNFIPIGTEHWAKPELWIGAKVGIFATMEPGIRAGGYADFDWFRIEK
jgi:hypothetical protein